jgi:hypothetical protein
MDELRHAAREAGVSSAAAAAKLQSLTSASVSLVEAVQRELGALNLAMNEFVLTDALDIENLPAFDAWRDRLIGALHRAEKAIAALEAKEEPAWSAALSPAWDRFRQRLEVVRILLESGEATASEEFATLRTRLKDLRATLASDPEKAREQLRHLSTGTESSADYRRLDGWIKALLMWRERGQQ